MPMNLNILLYEKKIKSVSSVEQTYNIMIILLFQKKKKSRGDEKSGKKVVAL